MIQSISLEELMEPQFECGDQEYNEMIELENVFAEMEIAQEATKIALEANTILAAESISEAKGVTYKDVGKAIKNFFLSILQVIVHIIVFALGIVMAPFVFLGSLIKSAVSGLGFINSLKLAAGATVGVPMFLQGGVLGLFGYLKHGDKIKSYINAAFDIINDNLGDLEKESGTFSDVFDSSEKGSWTEEDIAKWNENLDNVEKECKDAVNKMMQGFTKKYEDLYESVGGTTNEAAGDDEEVKEIILDPKDYKEAINMINTINAKKPYATKIKKQLETLQKEVEILEGSVKKNHDKEYIVPAEIHTKFTSALNAFKTRLNETIKIESFKNKVILKFLKLIEKMKKAFDTFRSKKKLDEHSKFNELASANAAANQAMADTE